jgi:hypothetical protein
MPEPNNDKTQAIRDAAYFLWESDGRPEGHALEYWLRAKAAVIPEEERVLAGDPDANMPALLTKDVPGG